jgi:transposase
MLVFAQVSSMKTRRLGVEPSLILFPSHPKTGDVRTFLLAWQHAFFEAQPLGVDEVLDRPVIDLDAALSQFSLKAPQGEVAAVGYARKLGPLVPIIDAILEADKTAPRKQRHTAKRIFERLRIEHGYAGGYTVVKDYVRIARTRSREVFVPLAHPPGRAQVDFSECIGVIGGVRMKLHVFCFDLPQSDACFINAYPAETTEAFLDGHVSAFAFFGGVPISILYDNLKIAVARILGDGKRQPTRAFTELVSHYLFQEPFGRPGKGNDKGKVEALVKYSRTNFLTPVPSKEAECGA